MNDSLGLKFSIQHINFFNIDTTCSVFSNVFFRTCPKMNLYRITLNNTVDCWLFINFGEPKHRAIKLNSLSDVE